MIFAILAVVSYFVGQDEALTDNDNDAALPSGYYLSGAVLSTTDDSGVLLYQLRAKRIEHSPRDDAITLTELELDYGNTAKLWQVSADRGQMPKSNNQIALIGDVTTRLLNAPDHGATQMHSATLNIDLKAQTAATDDPVAIIFDRGSLNGIGLDIDLANETFTLRSNVAGVFAPPMR